MRVGPGSRESALGSSPLQPYDAEQPRRRRREREKEVSERNGREENNEGNETEKRRDKEK